MPRVLTSFFGATAEMLKPPGRRYCNFSPDHEERLKALASELAFDEMVVILKEHAHGGIARIGLLGYGFDSDGL